MSSESNETGKGVLFDDDAMSVEAYVEGLKRAREEEREKVDLHCYAQRKVASLLTVLSRCSVCTDEKTEGGEDVRGYQCITCKTCEVCVACFPQAMLTRLTVAEMEVTYTCPICNEDFSTILRSPRPSET